MSQKNVQEKSESIKYAVVFAGVIPRWRARVEFDHLQRVAQFHASSEATCFFAMAIGCLANWGRNRTFHCAITGPLFLIVGVMFLLSGVRTMHVNTRWVWPFLLIGVGIAFLLERLYAQRSGS